MTKESEEFSAKQVMEDLVEDVKYATAVLGAGRAALLESNIGKSFNGKPPRVVMMHAISRALTSPEVESLDSDQFRRGVIALALFYLEDEDVNLALKIKDELLDADKK